MTKIKQSTQLNGVSVAWGARLLVIAICFLLIGIGLQKLLILVIGLLLIIFSIGLALSKTSIHLNNETNTVHLYYRNLFRKKSSSYILKEGDIITFKHENHSEFKIDFIIASTNWYPVKNASYFVVIQSEKQEVIILDECIDLKETYSLARMFSKKLDLKFISPLKSRVR